jgi:hypothetical protein
LEGGIEMGFEGRNLVTALAEQSAKDSPSDTLTKILATSNSLEKQINNVQSEALTGNRFSDNQYVSGDYGAGGIDGEVEKDMIPTIIKNSIGAEDSSPEDLGTGGPYKHIFTPDSKLTTWLTLLKYFDSETFWELYTDAKINQLDLSVTSQAILTYTLDIVAINYSKGTTSPTETINDNTGERLFAWDSDVITYDVGTEDLDIKGILDEFSFTHNNNLDSEDYGLSKVLRTLDAQDSEHTISITAQFSASEYDIMKDDLEEGAEIPIDIGIGSANSDSDPYIKFSYPKIKLNSVQANVGGPGKVTVDIEGGAFWDSTAGYNVAVEIIDDQDTQY